MVGLMVEWLIYRMYHIVSLEYFFMDVNSVIRLQPAITLMCLY